MESIFASLAYILENMHPTIITILSAALFEAADRYLVRNGEAADLWGYAALIIIYFVLYNILRTFSSVCINAGIYEKAMHWLNNDIVAAASRFPLIQYENDEMLTCKRRAMECVKNDRIPGIFMLLIVLITSISGIFSLLVTLGIYHPLLPIIAVASVLQFIFSNWVLEKKAIGWKHPWYSGEENGIIYGPCLQIWKVSGKCMSWGLLAIWQTSGNQSVMRSMRSSGDWIAKEAVITCFVMQSGRSVI